MPDKPEAVKQRDPLVHVYLQNILLFTLEEKPGVTPSIIVVVTQVHSGGSLPGRVQRSDDSGFYIIRLSLQSETEELKLWFFPLFYAH